MSNCEIPPVTVTLPAALLTLFPGLPSCIEIRAGSVDELMHALDARWPGLRDRLCDSRPSIRPHINVFVEGEKATLRTRLPPGADVLVMTAMSGG